MAGYLDGQRPLADCVFELLQENIFILIW